MTMPALTVWQPWASLIAAHAKPYEFRGWAAPRALVGRRIAIHAGARPIKRAEVQDLLMRLAGPEAWSTGLRADLARPILERVLTAPGVLPLSSVVCTAVLGAPRRANEIVFEFGGPVNDSDRGAHTSWAWPLAEIDRLEPPAPTRGAQGFWQWSDARAA